MAGAKDQSGCATCKCECPTFDAMTCQSQCTQMKAQFIEGAKSIHGCNICQCGCMNRDCSAECQGHQYEIEADAGGCITRCHCVCPVLDCDAPCGGVGLGIEGPLDQAGCATTCNGCRQAGGYQIVLKDQMNCIQNDNLSFPKRLLIECIGPKIIQVDHASNWQWHQGNTKIIT